jgi:hypothetical protein
MNYDVPDSSDLGISAGARTANVGVGGGVLVYISDGAAPLTLHTLARVIRSAHRSGCLIKGDVGWHEGCGFLPLASSFSL